MDTYPSDCRYPSSPIQWVFRLKPLDDVGNFLRKAQCCVRGDQQKPFTDYDPDKTYAPVAAHDTLGIILAFAGIQNLELEGADISNAYLYGRLDIIVIMEQPMNSSRLQRRPGHVAEAYCSTYGTKQTGKIRGSLLGTCLKSWKLSTSRYDDRLYFLRKGKQFVFVAIVFDDI